MNISLFKESHRVTELDHAFRINGVVDIWKNGSTIYDIVNNKYFRIYDEDKQREMCSNLLDTYTERPDFKGTNKGRMAYQEFKHIKKTEKYDYNAVRAEDYHWKENINKVSEDHLYMLIHGDDVKIGRSKTPLIRFNDLKTAFSNNAKMYVFFNKGFMENTLHKCFIEIKKRGEWFRHCIRITHFINKYHVKKASSIIQ